MTDLTSFKADSPDGSILAALPIPPLVPDTIPELRRELHDLGTDLFMPAERPNGPALSTRPSLSYWKDAWIRLRRNRQALISLGLIVFFALFTLAGPLIWKSDPSAQDLARISEPPSTTRSAVVLGELAPYDETVLADIPEKPVADASRLEAPKTLELIGEASSQSVRLRWTPVIGAASYQVYRAEGSSGSESGGSANLGVPIAEVDGGNHVSYEDKFNLESNKRYYYSIVPKNGDESKSFITLGVSIPASISLEDALKIKADAQPGQTLLLPGHPLGTDYLGRDLLARLMSGARVSLFIGFFAPMLSVIIGVLLGGISGYLGGRADAWLMRFTDFVLALPFLLFMILFKVAFGASAGESGILPMLVAMVALSWTGPARLTRGQILQLRESEFVHAARLLGARSGYILLRHLLPNTLGVILVSLTFAIPSAIFTEAFLSFIGMGVVPPTPSWGSMCNDGIQTFLIHPHEFLAPAAVISLTVLAFNLLGDGLRDALDPRMRGR